MKNVMTLISNFTADWPSRILICMQSFCNRIMCKVSQFRARLFKTNDVASKRFVKTSNVNISNMPIFFVEKI